MKIQNIISLYDQRIYIHINVHYTLTSTCSRYMMILNFKERLISLTFVRLSRLINYITLINETKIKVKIVTHNLLLFSRELLKDMSINRHNQ